MKEKYKELIADIGLTTTLTIGEALWTSFLVCSSSKIPIIGIPIATSLGIVGVLGTIWLANSSRVCYEDWCKRCDVT